MSATRRRRRGGAVPVLFALALLLTIVAVSFAAGYLLGKFLL